MTPAPPRLVSILRSNVSGGKNQPRVWLCLDQLGNVTSITDPAANVRTFTYDPTFAKATSITDPLGNVTRFEYDAQGNLAATINPLGARTTLTYDGLGLVTSSADPLGNITALAYDVMSRLIQRTDPDPDGGGSLTSPVTAMLGAWQLRQIAAASPRVSQ